MVDYPLTDGQKRMVHSLLPWLRDQTLSTEWIVFCRQDGTIASISGLDRQGILWRSGWSEARKKDFDKFVEVGLMRELSIGMRGEVQYSLDEYALTEAISTNFKRAESVPIALTETYNITVTDSIFNFKSFLSNVTQQLNAAPALDSGVKAELLNEIHQLTDLLQIAPAEMQQDVNAITRQLERLTEDLTANPPEKKTAIITAEGLKNAAKSLILILPAASVIIEKIAQLVQNVGPR